MKNVFDRRYSPDSCAAVSEVMDFILILGILAISLSIIALGGYPVLKSTQKSMYTEYTRQNFIMLANNINKVPVGQSPSQSMELKIYGGKLSVTGNSTIYVTAKNSTGQSVSLVNQQMRSIESPVDDTIIAYEGTGVWIKYPDGTTLNAYRPLINNQNKVLIIPVVQINGFSSIGGSSTSKITVRGTPEVTFYRNLSNITLTINSKYMDGWRDYYRDVMSWDECLPGDCTVQLNASNIDVYILKTLLDTEVR